MKAATIKIDGVHFSYGKNSVIHGISLDICRGEVLGILGPNGAGKSTLLQLIGGTLTPAAGSISIDERPMARMSARDIARRIAHVSQSPVAPMEFTCIEIVLMGRTPYLPPFGFESKDDVVRALAAMEETDCVKFASRKIDELSGGERQRVFLARAIAQDTKALILDEPTTHLDINHIQKIHSFLRAQAVDGKTIVCALHDVPLAASLCDKNVMMKNGRIVKTGTPQEVLTIENISLAFDADVRVKTDPETGLPYFLY